MGEWYEKIWQCWKCKQSLSARFFFKKGVYSKIFESNFKLDGQLEYKQKTVLWNEVNLLKLHLGHAKNDWWLPCLKFIP